MMATSDDDYRRIEGLRLAILESKPGTRKRYFAVKRATRASLAAPDDGLSLQQIEELCDYADVCV